MKRRRSTRKAVRAWKDFHERDDVELLRFKASATPRRLWSLGPLRAVVYERTGDGEVYEHKFRRPYPLLCTDARGRRLYIIGGGYHTEARGIVG